MELRRTRAGLSLQVQGRGDMCHVAYYSGGNDWVPYEYCVGTHGANGPTVRREDFDEHGEHVDHYD